MKKIISILIVLLVLVSAAVIFLKFPKNGGCVKQDYAWPGIEEICPASAHVGDIITLKSSLFGETSKLILAIDDDSGIIPAPSAITPISVKHGEAKFRVPENLSPGVHEIKLQTNERFHPSDGNSVKFTVIP